MPVLTQRAPTHPSRKSPWWAALVLVPLALAGCPGPEGEALDCGAGTIESNGVCVVDPNIQTRCGAGSRLDATTNTCVPVASCGPGTTLNPQTGNCESDSECGPGTTLNLATGQCEPDAACGPGTAVNPETGACETVIVCGPGTTLAPATGRCVGPEPCTPGTVVNPATGLCESDLVCGDDQVIVGDRCVTLPDQLAGEADATEPVVDNNDPDRGGTPLPLDLEGIGEETVFVGVIGRDVDPETGRVSQDRDFWSFEGTAGQALSLQVLSFGLDEPVFVVRGPGNYLRRSSVGYEAEPQRELILPRSGTYTIEVVPGAFVQTGVPTGSSGARYIGVLEVIPFPTPTAVVPGADPTSAAVVTGDLLDLTDNVFAIDQAPGAVAVIELQGLTTTSTTVPALFALRADGTLAAEQPNLRTDLPWLAVVQEGGEDVRVVIDWISSTAPAGTFNAQVSNVVVVDAGDVVLGDVRDTAAIPVVPHLGYGAWRLTVQETQMLDLELRGPIQTPSVLPTDPDVLVQTPDASVTFEDDDDFFFFAEPGTYVVTIRNDLSAVVARDYVNSVIRLAGVEVTDLGDFGVGDEASLSDDLILPGFAGLPDVWARVNVVEPVLLSAALDLEGGSPRVSWIGVDSISVRDSRVEQHGMDTSVLRLEPGLLLLRLSPTALSGPTQAVVGWNLNVSARAVPPFVDVEPNDVFNDAVLLGSVNDGPIEVRGRVEEDAIDLLAFDIGALPPGQVAAVTIESVNGNEATSTSNDDRLFVQIYDDDFLPAASIPDTSAASTPGVGNTTTELFIGEADGPGRFIVELRHELFADITVEYVVRVELLELNLELEENASVGDALDVGDAPFDAFGFIDAGADADVYRFTLPTALPADTHLNVAVDNRYTANNLETLLTVETAGGVVLGTNQAVFARVRLPELAAGDYVVRVQRDPTFLTGAIYGYRLSARVEGKLETEPNDESAQVLPPVGPSTAGFGAPVIDGVVQALLRNTTTSAELPGDVDQFILSADPPLGADESFIVRLVNIAGSRAILLEAFDGADPAAVRLALDEDTVSAIVARPTANALRVRVSDLITFTGSTATFDGRVVKDSYRLLVERAGSAESEPNNDTATADVIAVGDVKLAQVGPGDVDVWTAESPALAPGERVTLRLRNLFDPTALNVNIQAVDPLDPTGPLLPVLTASGNTLELFLEGPLPASTLFGTVTNSVTSGTGQDLYELEVTLD